MRARRDQAESKDAVHKTQREFKGWGDDGEKTCASLVTHSTGQGATISWDIWDLHNNGWILNYRPECATIGANPACGSTVQVGTECYYAGSVNYVIFGTMCKLCSDYYGAREGHGRPVELLRELDAEPHLAVQGAL